MGRIRTVKPELFTHEGLYDLEQKTGLPIRICWCGLFTAADREGRFLWRPRTLKTSVAPYDGLDFAKVLDALFEAGFIDRYQVDGDTYGCIPTWAKHQVVNNKERDSTIPPPPEPRERDATTTREPRDEHATWGEGKGKGTGKGSGTGRDGNGTGSGKEPPLVLRPAQKAEHAAAEIIKLIGIRGKGGFLQTTLSDVALMHFEENPQFEVETITKFFCEAWVEYNFVSGQKWLLGKRVSPESFYSDGLYKEYNSWSWKDEHGPVSQRWEEDQAEMKRHVKRWRDERNEIFGRSSSGRGRPLFKM